MELKFVQIEYEDQSTGAVVAMPVASAFCLAVRPEPLEGEALMSGLPPHNYGLKLGVAIPHRNNEGYRDFEKSFFGSSWKGFYKAFLLAERGIKIPILIHGGNAWDQNYGTSCLFGYFTPAYFATRPKRAKPDHSPDAPPDMEL